VHRCLVYGRYKVSDSQLDRLAAGLGKTRRRLVVTADGRHFNRFDLARFLSRELGRRGARLDETAEAPLFVFCVEQAFYACIPVRRGEEASGREARTAEREGSLPPGIAAAMAFLTRPDDGDTILDPVCGSGTLLAEAAAYAPGASLYGVDSDPRALKAARRNLSRLPDCTLAEGDARTLELADGSVSLALANLPFGKQYGDAVENRALYGELLGELRRLAAPTGFRAALLASDVELLRDSAQAAGFAVQREVPIKVRGEPATILLLQRA
jgi:tRNA G10  N-methylase Trm11